MREGSLERKYPESSRETQRARVKIIVEVKAGDKNKGQNPRRETNLGLRPNSTAKLLASNRLFVMKNYMSTN